MHNHNFHWSGSVKLHFSLNSIHDIHLKQLHDKTDKKR